MDMRERIQAEAAARNLSMRALSLRAGLSDSALHKYITGGIQSLTLESLTRIAAALDIPLKELMFGVDSKTAPDVLAVWDCIPDDRKSQAMTILRTFAEGCASR